MKKILILILSLAWVQVSAQKSKVKQASKAFENYNLEVAKTAIEEASKHSKTSEDWKTWMLKGDIYTELSKEEMTEEAGRAYEGKTAFDAYVRAMSFAKSDQKGMLTGKLSELKKVMMSMGLSYMTNGQNRESMRSLKLGVTIGEEIGEEAGAFHAMIGSMYMQDALFLPAAEAYMKSVEAGHEVETQMTNALSALSLGNSPKYESVLSDYRSRYPENIGLKINAVNHLLGKGESKGAIPLLKELVEEEPFNMNYRYHLGVALLDMKDIEGLEHLDVRLKQDPYHLPSLQQLATYYFSQANEIQQQLGQLDFESDAARQKEQARNEQFKEMTRFGERALIQDPENMQLLKALATAYSLLEDDTNFKRISRKIDLLKD